MKKIVYQLLAIALFSMAMNACGPSVKQLSVENGRLPSSVRGYQGTILILEDSKQYNKQVMEIFSEFYKGKFLLVKSTRDFDDRIAYRFLLEYSYSPGSSSSHGSTHIYLKDREANKQYLISNRPSQGHILTALAKALEIERNK
jgi:hypothetical protein